VGANVAEEHTASIFKVEFSPFLKVTPYIHAEVGGEMDYE
jgi:hypothetical protein